MAAGKRDAVGYGRINLAKKTGKPYFSLTMKDEFGNNVYQNGFINNLVECYIDLKSMAIICYVEEVYHRGTFGSSSTRKIETVSYEVNSATGVVIRNILNLDDVLIEYKDAIRTILFPIKTGEDAKFPHVTFYKQDSEVPGDVANPDTGGNKPYPVKEPVDSNPYGGDEGDPF